MPFLKAVQKENARKNPIVPFNWRTTSKDLVIKGYKVPKGSTVFMEWGCFVNLEETFPQPEVYHPTEKHLDHLDAIA